MKNWEGNVYDGRIKINHNPEINLKKNTTEVKTHTTKKPFQIINRYRSTKVIRTF